MAKRKEYNDKLIKILSNYLDKYPQLRFHQALQNLFINERQQGDRFFEESEETYNYIVQQLGNERIEEIEHFL